MKSVAIFRHFAGEGPGYFATFLDRHSIPWQLICVDEGASIPDSLDGFSGLCFMGGPMSVNDDLPWIPPALALIRAAVAADMPVLGHCLGGQLISKALGGVISRNPVKEIGWGEVSSLESAPCILPSGKFTVFHWHGETFSIPPGATRILESRWCANQGYVIGKTIGLQCHIEMTEGMVQGWSEDWTNEIARAHARGDDNLHSVQTAAQMCADIPQRLPALHAIADQLYSHWIKGLKT